MLAIRLVATFRDLEATPDVKFVACPTTLDPTFKPLEATLEVKLTPFEATLDVKFFAPFPIFEVLDATFFAPWLTDVRKLLDKLSMMW